jgi:cbb3-type cytochrome oxidase subunit 3
MENNQSILYIAIVIALIISFLAGIAVGFREARRAQSVDNSIESNH